MIRAVAAPWAALAVLASPALAFDPSAAPRYSSPDYYRPNVDDLTVQRLRNGSAPPASLGQILGSTFSVAQDGRWGRTPADNDAVFGMALARSADPSTDTVTIDVPMGTWRLATPRAFSTTKPFKLRCAGRGDTKIIVDTGSNSLFTITQQTVGAQVSIEGCEFQAASPGVAAPIVIKYAGTAQGPSPYYQYSSVTLRDLSFVGLGSTATTGTNYFLNGIDLSNAWQPILSGIHFTGSVQNRRGAQNALVLHYTFAAQIHDFFAQYAVRGIYDPGGASNGQNSEGLGVHSGEIVDVDYGLELIGSDSDPGLFIGPLHINAGKSCVRTVFKSQFDIGRVLCYKLIGDSNDFNAFDIQNAAYGYIWNAQIADSRPTNTGGAFTGIKLTNSFGITINGVQAQNWRNATGALVYLAGTTDGGRFHSIDSSLVAGLSPVAFDATTVGKGNLFFDTLPAVLQSLDLNSATPNVGNDRSGLWTTVNTTATAITGFQNLVSGQQLSIFFQDSVTTLVHNDSLRLKGGVNAAPSAGSTITLKMIGGFLTEVSRSF